ncbi:MAG TPA: A/G-specific adenine glycosylase [Edaphocola sp.]|nr:A/G-specific adenine glycosylase [Edaphocola sp.]
MKNNFFAKQLLAWNQNDNSRAVPWRGATDPYKIWLSEIMLQQTRLEQGLPYYLKFIEQYPTVHDLAQAPEEEVFLLWQGLGYYSRCRNLIYTAKFISENLKGNFPDNYKELLKLKGVGAYTAAAIASFAFGEAVPVIDGNVYRVLSRFFATATPIDTTEGKKKFQYLIQQVFDPAHPAEFNQAIMDLGATVCTPKKPDCQHCPLNKYCKAYHQVAVECFPVKSKKIIVKHRTFDYWVFIFEEKVFIKKREEKDIWQGLFEFYQEEFEVLQTRLKSLKCVESLAPKVFETKQKLTHQIINSTFSIVKINEVPDFLNTKGMWVPIEALKKFAFPRTILSFLKEIHYFYYLK